MSQQMTDERKKESCVLMEKNPIRLYWDYRDELTDDMISEYFSERKKHSDWSKQYKKEHPEYVPYVLPPEQWLEEYLLDHYYQTSDGSGDREHIKEVLKENDFSEEEIEELLNDGDVYSCVSVDVDIEHFLETDVRVRFKLFSDFGCANSFFYECLVGFISLTDTYIGDAARVLGVTREALSEYWNMDEDEDQEQVLLSETPLITAKEFTNMFEETTSGANLLTLLAEIPFRDIANKEFTLGKGSPVGFFSDQEGAGSCFDVYLSQPMTIQLGKPLEPETNDTYPHWGMCVDSLGGCYGVVDTYGSWLM